MSTAKSRLSFGERAVFWMYDKIREWSRMWLTHFFLLFIAAGYCAAGALVFQAVEWKSGNDNTKAIERNRLIIGIANVRTKARKCHCTKDKYNNINVICLPILYNIRLK